MNKFDNFINSTKNYISKHSPEILTGLGISSMIASTVFAIKATPKAMILLGNASREKEQVELKIYADNEEYVASSYGKLSVRESVKAVWKEYIPAASFGIGGIILLISACKINSKRGAALATAYAVSQKTLMTYRDKVIETIGEKKEKEIQQKIKQDEINKDESDNKLVILSSKGNTLFKDEYSGRYFKGDLEQIRKSINELNRSMFSQNYVSLNEYYTKIGLEPVKDGYQLGWNIERGYIDIDIDACLTKDEEACICISFVRSPEPNF